MNGSFHKLTQIKSKTILQQLHNLARESLSSWFILCKIMIPVMIIVQLFTLLEWIEPISNWISPVMELVGLPGELSFVWASALTTNIYASLIVWSSLGISLTVAQTTTMAIMLLIAHSLPNEIKIAHMIGLNAWYVMILRISVAILIAFSMSSFFSVFNLLDQDTPKFILSNSNPSWEVWLHPIFENDILNIPLFNSNLGLYLLNITIWTIKNVMNLLSILAIIFVLFSVLKLIRLLKIMDLVETVLQVFLRFMGMKKHASEMILIGLFMGMTYGAGVLLNERKKGHLSKTEIFMAITFLSLCHSIIEDTLLLVFVGGDYIYLLLFRLIPSFLLCTILYKIVNHFPKLLRRFLNNSLAKQQ